jgi:hypothetical protein
MVVIASIDLPANCGELHLEEVEHKFDRVLDALQRIDAKR